MKADPILVTGATGYVGGRLIPALLAAGYPEERLHLVLLARSQGGEGFTQVPGGFVVGLSGGLWRSLRGGPLSDYP